MMRGLAAIRSLCIALALVAWGLPAYAQDWPSFRGPNASGVAGDGELPIDWLGEVAWKVDLPGRGPSSPIVVKDAVLVTASSGADQDRLHVFCFDAASGAKRWERQAWATGRCFTNPTTAVAAPTPASDGERVFAHFSSNDLICYDLAGNLQWYRGLSRDYPLSGNDVGLSSSPVVIDGVVIVQVDCQGDSFAAGFNATTGETLWRIDRPHEPSWSSPIALAREKGPALVVLQSSAGLTAVEAKTGKPAWSLKNGCDGISSSVVANGSIYVPGGGMTVLRPPTETGEPSVLWQDNKLPVSASSPIVYRGQVFAVNSAGVLACGDAATGQVVWRLRLKGRYWATPIAAGNHLHLVNSDGIVQIVKLGEKGELAKECELGEAILATPAASAGSLFLRSDAHLWRIGKGK